MNVKGGCVLERQEGERGESVKGGCVCIARECVKRVCVHYAWLQCIIIIMLENTCTCTCVTNRYYTKLIYMYVLD